MNDLGFVAFPANVVICYLVGATLKEINNDTLYKFIPMICGFIGGGLAVIVFKTIPNYIPADNWLMALAIGIVSGFAATGINQVYKQFTQEDTYDGVFEGEVPNSEFTNENEEDPDDETKEEE